MLHLPAELLYLAVFTGELALETGALFVDEKIELRDLRIMFLSNLVELF